jgi:MFS family permease
MLIVFLAINAARTVVSYKALEFGAGNFEIGLIASSYSFLPFIMGLPLGMSIDRFGANPFLAVGSLVCLLSCLLLLSAPTLVVLAFGQAFLGMSHTTVAISVQARAATVGPEVGRDKRFAHVAVIAATGQFVGPLIAAWTIGRGSTPNNLPDTDPTFVVASAIALLSVLVALLVWVMGPRSGQVKPRGVVPRPNLRDALLRPGVMRVLLASLAALAATDLMIAYLPVIAQNRSLSAAFVGVLLSLAAGAGLISRVLVVPLLSVLPGRSILLGGLMLASLGASAILLAQAQWSFAVAVGAVGLGVGVAAPIVGSWMAGAAPIGERGTSLALRMTANRLGQVLVPLSFGVMATLLGPVSIFAAIAVMLVASVNGLRKISMEG